MGVMIEVKPYHKADGYRTRHWAVYVDGELLAVVLYRKGAQAIADLILNTRAGKAASDAA
jgi:hypothetical protein